MTTVLGEMTKEIDDRTDAMVERIRDSFSDQNNPQENLPMYSYDRAGRTFWRLIIESMMQQGASDREVEIALQSKEMRWMLDSLSDDFEKAVKQLVSPHVVAWSQGEAALEKKHLESLD